MLLPKKLGSASSTANQFGGLQMESDAMQNFYGKGPASTSNQRNTLELTGTEKSGVKA